MSSSPLDRIVSCGAARILVWHATCRRCAAPPHRRNPAAMADGPRLRAGLAWARGGTLAQPRCGPWPQLASHCHGHQQLLMATAAGKGGRYPQQKVAAAGSPCCAAAADRGRLLAARAAAAVFDGHSISCFTTEELRSSQDEWRFPSTGEQGGGLDAGEGLVGREILVERLGRGLVSVGPHRPMMMRASFSRVYLRARSPACQGPGTRDLARHGVHRASFPVAWPCARDVGDRLP